MPNKSKEIGLLEQFLSEDEFNNVTVALEPHSGGSYIVVYGEPKDE